MTRVGNHARWPVFGPAGFLGKFQWMEHQANTWALPPKYEFVRQPPNKELFGYTFKDRFAVTIDKKVQELHVYTEAFLADTEIFWWDLSWAATPGPRGQVFYDIDLIPTATALHPFRPYRRGIEEFPRDDDGFGSQSASYFLICWDGFDLSSAIRYLLTPRGCRWEPEPE